MDDQTPISIKHINKVLTLNKTYKYKLAPSNYVFDDLTTPLLNYVFLSSWPPNHSQNKVKVRLFMSFKNIGVSFLTNLFTLARNPTHPLPHFFTFFSLQMTRTKHILILQISHREQGITWNKHNVRDFIHVHVREKKNHNIIKNQGYLGCDNFNYRNKINFHSKNSYLFFQFSDHQIGKKSLVKDNH